MPLSAGQAWLAGGRNPVRFAAGVKRVIGPVAERVLAETLDACTGADLILSPTLGFVGHANRLSFQAVDHLGRQSLRPFVNPWRREVFGLPKLPLRGPMHRVRDVPVLCCFSEAVVARPPDRPPNVHLTGYWFLDEPAWTPDPALAEFLAAGPPRCRSGRSTRGPGPGASGRPYAKRGSVRTRPCWAAGSAPRTAADPGPALSSGQPVSTERCWPG